MNRQAGHAIVDDHAPNIVHNGVKSTRGRNLNHHGRSFYHGKFMKVAEWGLPSKLHSPFYYVFYGYPQKWYYGKWGNQKWSVVLYPIIS
jgi:hypothetical protein